MNLANQWWVYVGNSRAVYKTFDHKTTALRCAIRYTRRHKITTFVYDLNTGHYTPIVINSQT